jgi:hypothetical protein
MRATETAATKVTELAHNLGKLVPHWIENAGGLTNALLQGKTFKIPLPRSRTRAVEIYAHRLTGSPMRYYIEAECPLTDRDAATAYFVVRAALDTSAPRYMRLARQAYGPGVEGRMWEPRLLGYGYRLHKTLIAVQHAACGGWATHMDGYDTPTTRARLNALTGLHFRQEKRQQYAGNMPIDPHRVHVHPSGIAWAMPQYNNPAAWLYDRANKDEEYQYEA